MSRSIRSAISPPGCARRAWRTRDRSSRRGDAAGAAPPGHRDHAPHVGPVDVARSVLEPGRRAVGVRREPVDVADEEPRRRGRRDAHRRLGEQGRVRLLRRLTGQPLERVGVPQRVAQRDPCRVDEERVRAGRAAAQIEERLDVRGVRVETERLGRGTANERVLVTRSRQHGGPIVPRPRGRLREHAHPVRPHRAVGVRSDLLPVVGVELVEARQHPEGVRPRVRTRGAPEEPPHERRPGLPDAVHQLVRGQEPPREAGVLELPHQVAGRGSSEIRLAPGGGRWSPAVRARRCPLSRVGDPPDPPARPVSTGVVEANLVVPDDPVVEVGDVERAVRPLANVDRPEPGVTADDEVGRLHGANRRPSDVRAVEVDTARDHVADEEGPPVLRRETAPVVARDSGDGRRAVEVLHHGGHEAEAIVRAAEARVVAAPQELVRGSRVAVRGEQVAERVDRHPERVDLAVREVLDARAVETEPVGVPGDHVDSVAVGPPDLGVVVEPVAGVDPAVEGAAEGVVQTVGVAVPAEGPVEPLPPVTPVVAVDVLEVPDPGDAEDDGAPSPGKDADRNVQAAGERRDPVGSPVSVGVLEDLDVVTPRPAGGRGEGVLACLGDPEPPPRPEREVQGLQDRRLRGHQVDLESGRQAELPALLLRRQARRRTDVRPERVAVGGARHGAAEEDRQERDGRQGQEADASRGHGETTGGDRGRSRRRRSVHPIASARV